MTTEERKLWLDKVTKPDHGPAWWRVNLVEVPDSRLHEVRGIDAEPSLYDSLLLYVTPSPTEITDSLVTIRPMNGDDATDVTLSARIRDDGEFYSIVEGLDDGQNLNLEQPLDAHTWCDPEGHKFHHDPRFMEMAQRFDSFLSFVARVQPHHLQQR